ncbi:hypothetical protein PVT01_000079700 [Plasmodium vivax]|uniref:VIR protein n=1 Tax=Plasmodium vivax TaxID=5855 RepID=A0A1G4EAG5_PLAVI|nr:hypothetical protein PVT01_000079700 [Plasmodium vivax]
MLMQDSNYFDKENKSWCPDYKMSEFTKFPLGLTSPNCDETISEKSSSDVLLPITTEKDCPPCQTLPISPRTDQLPQTDQPLEKDQSKNLAVTSGFTAVGTLGNLFFLYRFTPMMSWFRRPGMNNVGTNLYMNPGGAESFLSMQQDNGSNNLFYHP